MWSLRSLRRGAPPRQAAPRVAAGDPASDTTSRGGFRTSGSKALLLSGRAEFLLALRARAQGAQVIVAVNAGAVAVAVADLDGVIPHGCRRLGARARLENWQRRRRRGNGRRECLLFLSLVVAGGAGAVFAQIRKIIVARVAVRPGDVHACPARNVNLHACRLSSRVNRY